MIFAAFHMILVTMMSKPVKIEFIPMVYAAFSDIWKRWCLSTPLYMSKTATGMLVTTWFGGLNDRDILWCWWQNNYVSEIFHHVGELFKAKTVANVSNRSPTFQSCHQNQLSLTSVIINGQQYRCSCCIWKLVPVCFNRKDQMKCWMRKYIKYMYHIKFLKIDLERCCIKKTLFWE